MPEQPDNHLDQILRDYAEARREGADLPLHPTTRKRLHAEVARRFKHASLPFWSRWRAFWPQIALSSGICLVLILVVISLAHRSPHAKRAQTVASTPAIPPPKLELKQNEGVVELRSFADSKDSVAVADSAPLPAGTSRQKAVDNTAGSTTSIGNAALELLGSSAPAALAKETPLAPTQLAKADQLTNLGAALRVQFAELPDRARRDTRPQVLGTFQVEIAGDDFRLLDKDGSVYAGQLFRVPPNEAQPVYGIGRGPASALAEAPNTAASSFHAQGTNRTLGKLVMIEGRYMERTNDLPSPEKTFSFTTNLIRKAAAPAALPRPRRSIVGQVTVGQTNRFPVTAVSVEP